MNNQDTSLKLKEILNSASWTQEQLARRLNLPLKTLNLWVNSKATPRANNQQLIDELYLDIVGRGFIEPVMLVNTEVKALNKHLTARQIITNQDMLDKITLYLTYHTNNIEGSTMTLSDVKQVLDDSNKVLANRTASEQVEARNHSFALYYLLDELNSSGKDFQWSRELILQTHLRLMNTLLPNAGMFRNHGVRVMGSRVALANYANIPQKLDNLIELINQPTDNLIEHLAQIHATFEQIHPFSDGNGRTGRLIMFIQALASGILPPLVAKERKQAYYKYLEVAQLQKEYEPLRLFVAESILFTNSLIK